MKTLAVRVAHQNRSALALAKALEAHPRVRRVWYPGLPSHPHHAVARDLMSGFGGIVTFAVKGALDDVSRFVDACRIPRIAPSLGGVESLIEQPALMSYFELSTEQREAGVGITDDLVRYAGVGLEDTDEAHRRYVLAALDRSAALKPARRALGARHHENASALRSAARFLPSERGAGYGLAPCMIQSWIVCAAVALVVPSGFIIAAFLGIESPHFAANSIASVVVILRYMRLFIGSLGLTRIVMAFPVEEGAARVRQ